MMSHLDTCSILTNDQHGFSKGLSTETQLLASVHDWSHTLHKGPCTMSCSLTSQRHFTVPYSRLVEKLRYDGIAGKANKVIEGLHNRRQRVVVNGSSSHWAPLTSGVPQGTVIGPILFLININDIQSGMASRMRLLADDSVIYRTINNHSDHLALRDDFTKLDLWASKWQMTFKSEARSIQNKAAGFVTHKYDRTTSVTGLKMSLNWPTVQSWWNYRDCLMWYKIHHGLIHISFPDSVSHKQKLGRHDHPLAYWQICPRVEAHSFYVITIPPWNGLPASVATATTLPAFQRMAMSNLFGLATP